MRQLTTLDAPFPVHEFEAAVGIEPASAASDELDAPARSTRA